MKTKQKPDQTFLDKISFLIRLTRVLGAATLQSLPIATLLLLVCAFSPVAVRAQPVIYVGSNTVSGLIQLHVMNSDGTGDRVVPVALPEVMRPSISKDGRFITITSQTPGRPSQMSKNVFLLNLLTAQLTQITQFEDDVTDNNYAFRIPTYHALSPDATTIAVWDYLEVRGGTTPFLETYRVSDGLLLNTVVINPMLDGATLGGNGVDWHPTQNLLVEAVSKNIPIYNMDTQLPSGQYLEGTALFQEASDQTLTYQLTFPVIWERNTVSTGLFQVTQNDYAPAFSPNGQQVAYLRADSIYDATQPNYHQSSIIEFHIINLANTNDYYVGSLPQGIFVTHLSWSRDGTKLVFDAGSQAYSTGFPLPLNSVVASSNALYIVNTNGTGLSLLHAALASFPVWTPAGTTFANLPGVVLPGGVPGSGTIDDCGQPIHLNTSLTAAGQCCLNISGGMTNLLYRILASTNCTTWQSIGTVPWTGMTNLFTDASNSNFPCRFYRVALGDN